MHTKSYPLNYLQSSPVRGQLDPYDERNHQGRRYLQCTDTPNEIKVLLPQSTTRFYEQLLQAELSELAQAEPIAWTRILEIRHLKDRMLRKCQRLARASPPRAQTGNSLAFRSFTAPPDFRLKELEKWLSQHNKDVANHGVKKRPPMQNARRASYCCSRCSTVVSDQPKAASPHEASLPIPDTQGGLPTPPLDNGSEGKALEMPSPGGFDMLNHVVNEVKSRSFLSEPAKRSERITPPPSPIEPHSWEDERPQSPKERSLSPVPLPYLFRPRSTETTIRKNSSSGGGEDSEDPSDDSDGEGRSPISNERKDQKESTLRRRRSCLKSASDKTSDAKSVSWATHVDWVEVSDDCAGEVDGGQTIVQGLEGGRGTLEEQITALQSMQLDVSRQLERLRLEAEELQRVERVIWDKEGKLRALQMDESESD